MIDRRGMPDDIYDLACNNATAGHLLLRAERDGQSYQWFLEQVAVSLGKQNQSLIEQAARDAFRNPRPIIIDAHGDLVEN